MIFCKVTLKEQVCYFVYVVISKELNYHLVIEWQISNKFILELVIALSAFYLILLHLFFFVNTSARTYDLVDVGDCKEVVHIQLKKTIEFIKYQKF